ncbi:PTS transporter subunit EIIC [Erysipelothrix inopinata]|uniref:PTS transporter subunit EIIC n=1 Tax=Erysipelothrix inopinata TaxID=225084 RepID=A0A7G9S1N1_9FIRM|nr:PTS transporter subunit EIIC [Erysipelothrix inopinata]QNN61756.1 PTS transporter subunit EIIC [Erysipelothrix inopinata]
MNNNETARKIIELVGTEDNISNVMACQTRLRFTLLDNKKANVDELKKLPKVLGISITETQFQVIIGPTVDQVLTEVEKELGGNTAEATNNQVQEKKKLTFQGMGKFLFDYISTAFSPVLISILGSGVLKGLNILFSTTLGWYAPTSGIGQMINLMGDIPFYFLPFFIAYGAAKKLNTSIPLALSLAGAYMHPSIAQSAANGVTWNIFGFNMPMIGYNGTVLPILFSVLVMSFVYKKVNELIPVSVRNIFVPVIVLLVIVPLQFLILGPAGYYLSGYVAVGLEKLFSLNSWVGGFVYGSLRQLLVMTGLHLSMTPIIMENIRVFGGDYLMPVHAMSSMAVAGTALGIYFKAKKPEIKSSAIATFIPGFIGVTEPGVFGLAVRFGKPWVPIAIGGGVASAFVAGMGAKSVAISLPGPLSFSIFAESLNVMIIGWVIAFVISFVIAYMMGVDETK